MDVDIRAITIALIFLLNDVIAQHDQEPEIRFDHHGFTAAQLAAENERRIHLRQLTMLEHETPAQSKAETLQFLQRVHNTCKNLKRIDPAPPGYCPYFYDSFTCWRPAPIGNWSSKTCPKYILGMHTPGVTISIFCKGVRNSNEPSHAPIPMWDYVSTNESHFLQLYGMCFESIQKTMPPSSTQALHVKLAEILRKTQMVGPICYSVSFVALALASLIFLSFRALHCPRNFIHLHLFLAFMIRALMCLLQYYLFNNGQSMAIDGEVTEENGVTKFVDPGPHWECKLLITLWNYSLVASYFWLLVEGLYLHNVVYFFVFRETGIAGYAIFGWVAPMVVLIPWIVVKVRVEDHLCWVAYLNLNYFWILRGPIMATIMINFFLFINMIRELFLKLKDSHITETRRYRKLAKSSVLLVVILGVYYFIISIPMLLLDTDQLTWPLLVCLSIEHIFGSLQGLMVALVYCFMNSEVRTVMRKRWYRWILLRQVSSGTYAAATAASGNGASRQASVPMTTLTTSLLPQLLANVNEDEEECEEDLSTRQRRSIFCRNKSSDSMMKNSNLKRAATCSSSTKALSQSRQGCPPCDPCTNCLLGDCARQGQVRFADVPATKSYSPDSNETVRANIIDQRDSDKSMATFTPAPRSQSICARQNSIRSRIQQLRKLESGDTIALLRMRSPHSLDIQEFIKSSRARKDDTELAVRLNQPLAPTKDLWLMRGKNGGREANRRYSLNSNLITYLPLSNFSTKTMSTHGRCATPLVKGCWHRQSTDAFL